MLFTDPIGAARVADSLPQPGLDMRWEPAPRLVAVEPKVTRCGAAIDREHDVRPSLVTLKDHLCRAARGGPPHTEGEFLDKTAAANAVLFRAIAIY